MKSKQQIKEELHKLIDSIEDEHILNVLKEDVMPYVIKNKAISPEIEDDGLTEEQQNRLLQAIRQAKDGKVISLETFYSKMKQWRTR